MIKKKKKKKEEEEEINDKKEEKKFGQRTTDIYFDLSNQLIEENSWI